MSMQTYLLMPSQLLTPAIRSIARGSFNNN
jgi:hypothetical protein